MKISSSYIVELTLAGIAVAAIFGPSVFEKFEGPIEPTAIANSRFHDECVAFADKAAAEGVLALFGPDSKRRVALEECIKRREAVAKLTGTH